MELLLKFGSSKTTYQSKLNYSINIEQVDEKFRFRSVEVCSAGINWMAVLHKYRKIESTYQHYYLVQKKYFCQKVKAHKHQKVPFISNLQKPVWGSKQDMLELATLLSIYIWCGTSYEPFKNLVYTPCCHITLFF